MAFEQLMAESMKKQDKKKDAGKQKESSHHHHPHVPGAHKASEHKASDV